VSVYLIWSNEHAMWWGPDERGYTGVIEAAGRYTREAAERIRRDASVGGQLTVTRTSASGERLDVPPEVAVPAPPLLREQDAGCGAEPPGEPVAYLVAERRGGRWMLGDEWVCRYDTLDEARTAAADCDEAYDIGVLIVVLDADEAAARSAATP